VSTLSKGRNFTKISRSTLLPDGNNVETTFAFVEATFDFVERIVRLVAFDSVASTSLLMWTELYSIRETVPNQILLSTRWKVLTTPSESVFVANTWQHLPHLIFCGPLVSNFSPIYGVFWPLLPHPSTDSNETWTWVFPFPLGTFP